MWHLGSEEDLADVPCLDWAHVVVLQLPVGPETVETIANAALWRGWRLAGGAF